MSKYIRDGIIYNTITSIILNGKQIINPKEEQILTAGYEVYVEQETLEESIANKLKEIDIYDSSDNVNVFYFNGMECWADKSTRVGLMNSTTIEKSAGRTSTKIVLNGYSFDIPVDNVLAMLSQLELYAKDCYDVTAQHKINVNALTTILEVKDYDYTIGYPEPLDFKTN